MKFLLVSAFVEDGTESGANRLRKLRAGLRSLGHECEILGPPGGFHAFGARKKWKAIRDLVKQAKQWSRAKQDGFVVVSIPPPWLLAVAVLLAILLPKRLVADFRDPILNPRINPRGFLYRNAVRCMEAFVIKRSCLVMVAATKISDFLFPVPAAPITVMAGIDDQQAEITRRSKARRNNLSVIYGGTFYGTRSPLPLLEAISLFRGSLSFDLYVSFNSAEEEAQVRSLMAHLNLEGRVRFHSRVPWVEFMEILRGAGAGLVITHSNGSDYAIPGKIFDYLTAGVLPWVISRDPALLNLLNDNHIPALITSDWNKDELLRGLVGLEAMLGQGTNLESKLEHLSSKAQAKILADSLSELRL